MNEDIEDIDSGWDDLADIGCDSFPCLGTGWVKVMTDTWEECGTHYCGQLHPQSKLLLLDEPEKLKEEDTNSRLRWKITKVRPRVIYLAKTLNQEQDELSKYELELSNRTPTMKKPPLRPNVPIIVQDDNDLFPKRIPVKR